MTTRVTNNDWFVATVARVVDESARAKTYMFDTPRPIAHLAGQHYELRLTAENGYQAARLYSAAMAGYGDKSLTLTIMISPEGEVSPYVYDDLKVGDQVELRGPFGRYFVWTPEEPRPVLLVGGGSGVLPVRAMLQAHQQSGSATPMKLLYSAKTYADLLYKADFLNSPDVTVTLTKNHPKDWKGSLGRINAKLLQRLIDQLGTAPVCYVCGMSSFVEAVSEALQALGIPPQDIKTERFN